MEAQIVYIKLLRLSLKSASNVSKIRLQELAAGIGELRQLLSCVVCRELLKDPYEPARRRCGHHVCRLCLRGRKRLKPSCEQCQDCFDFKTYKENKSMAWQVLCYQTLCKQLQHSLLYAQLAGQRPLNCRQYNELGTTMSRIQLPDETAQWFIREGANYNDMCDTFLPQPDRLTLKDIASLPAETPPTTAATTPELPYEQHLPEQQLSLTDIELEAAATGDQYMHHPLPLLASSSSAARMLQIPTAATQTIMTAGYMEPSWTDQVDLSAAFTLNTFGHSGATANYATYVLPSGCTELPLHMPAIGQVVEVPLEAMTASTSTAVVPVPEAVPATVTFKRRHAELLAEELQQQQLEQQQEKISRLPQKPTIISSVQVKPPTALAPLAAVPNTITATVPKTMAVTVPKTMTSTVPKAMHAAVTTVVPKTPIATSKLLTATPATTKALTATVAAAIPKATTSSLAVTVPKATTSLTATVPKATTSSLGATAPKTLTTPVVVKVSKASISLTTSVPKTLTTSVAAKAPKVSTSSTATAPKMSTSQTATIPKKLPTSVAAIATKTTLATASPSKGTTLTRSAVNAKTTTTAQAATMSKSTVSAKAQATVQAAAVVTTRSTATSRAAAAPVAPTTARVAAVAAPPKVIEKSPKELRASQKLKPKEKRGCRCGTSSAPGKATCRTTRCACYVVGLKCVDCKCNGCKNPHTYVGDSSDEDDTDSELEAEMEAEMAAEEAEVVTEEPVEASPPPPAPMPSGVTLVLVSNPQASQRPMVVMQNESGEYQYFNAFNGSVPIDPVEAGFPCVVMPPPPAPPSVEQTAKKFKVSPPQTEMTSHSRLESVDELLGASSKSKVVVGDCPQALFEDIMSGSDDLFNVNYTYICIHVFCNQQRFLKLLLGIFTGQLKLFMIAK
ncbi:E3 ubiquitin-protein ligase msl-2 [Drosophila sulfurigaster albostrigata]|uniref:E3 ubiquitin-protein ligase msl-2 n=1 Tax=Drosophila sulfurigaster albostrigata TaxID=89887 RepID=UPI002D21ED2B|nr:E3 ubiquitin-protein ligase msl-2 [Drosophila sulfurigaster albostrigata]